MNQPLAFNFGEVVFSNAPRRRFVCLFFYLLF
jgi:hypothetical protein